MADVIYKIVQSAFTRSNRRKPTSEERRMLRMCVANPKFRAMLRQMALSGQDLKVTICGGNIHVVTENTDEQAFAV
jgi:hypothetical protein